MNAPEPLADPLAELRDEWVFGVLFERHRSELQVHCYRMLGSVDDAEDLVQETFLRAWRGREGFGADGNLAFRAWLYRIATNACLDVLRTRSRRVLPADVVPPSAPTAVLPPPAELPWLQPYPDALLDQVTPPEDEPAAVVVSRETIELAFVAAIQHLPPRQRAVLILRDVLGWTARDAAGLLDTTVTSANSALQRARTTLRQRLGSRSEWRTSAASLAEEERDLLRRYLEAHERSDLSAFAALLREDARLSMPPHPIWFDGRAAILAAARASFDPAFGSLHSLPVFANRQPGAVHYLRAPGASTYVGLAIDLLRIEGGLVAEITSFASAEAFALFGLAYELDR